jgi:hypothetical protein
MHGRTSGILSNDVQLTCTIRIDVARLVRHRRAVADDDKDYCQHTHRLETILDIFSLSKSSTGYNHGHDEILARLTMAQSKVE